LGSTTVGIDGERFLIDGRPTYEGVRFRGQSIEGLLTNVRAVQATFDDENARTRSLWRYPDNSDYNANRQTDEFCAALPSWREHGVVAFTVNLQGGGPAYHFPYHKPNDDPKPNPEAYLNSVFERDGALKPAYLDRMGRVLETADGLGMVAIVGLFYFQQDGLLDDEAAVLRAVDGAVRWLLETGHHNVLVEINNECNIRYDHLILQPQRVCELIDRVKSTTRDGRCLLVSTSGGGGWLPTDSLLRTADFVLVHGNGCNADQHRRMIEQIRANPVFAGRPIPIVFNEAHPDTSCLLTCAQHGASWGYYDGGRSNYRDGFQSPPTNWAINTSFKQRFFQTARKLAAGEPLPDPQPPQIVGFDGLEPGQRVSGTIFVHADVNDSTLVDRVELAVDGKVVDVQNVWPFWLGGDLHKTPHGYDTAQLAPGRHELSARLLGTKGEISVKTVEFEVARAKS